MNIFLRKIDEISARTYFLAHFAINSIGIFVFVELISSSITRTMITPINQYISYSEWAILSTVHKPLALMHYGFSVIALGLYYSLVLLFVNKISAYGDGLRRKYNPSRILITSYFAFLIMLNVFLLKGGGFLFVWAIVVLIPLAVPIIVKIDNLDNVASKGGRFSALVILLLVGAIIWPFKNYWLGMPISNDYLDIPEQTIMTDGIVDNTTFINEHKIAGFYKHDPRIAVNDQEGLFSENAIKLEWNESIEAFVQENQQNAFYDKRRGLLYLKERPKPKEGTSSKEGTSTFNLAELMSLSNNSDERTRITSFYYKNKSSSKRTRQYTAQEKEFIKKNATEMTYQSVAGHYFHHQNTILGTINEYVLGKPVHETIFLYGWLSTVIIAESMEFFGGVNLDIYQKVFYSFYPIYYLLILVVSAFIFRSAKYVIFIGMASISCLYMVEFETIRFAPGFNPIRHFGDIFVLLSFYWYLFAKRSNHYYLGLAFLFSIVAILLSKEFGLVLFLSLLAAVAFRISFDYRKYSKEIIYMIVAIVVAVIAILLIQTAKNPTLIYVLLGVAAPLTNRGLIYASLLVFSVVYIFLFGNKRLSDDKWAYLTLFWFLYAQGQLIYYIWNPASNHFFSIGSVYVLLVALLIRQLFVNYGALIRYEKPALIILNIIIGMVFFLPNAIIYQIDQGKYLQMISNHKQHYWNLDRAQFVTTMEPSIFETTVELINKYSSNNSMHMISKYDNILPFMSGKYNLFPFTELDLSLVTTKEVDMVLDEVRNNKPEYIFVDTDIDRTHIGDVADWYDPLGAHLYDYSRGRAMVLDNFGAVFRRIKDLYEPVEIGSLITVYKRRNLP